MQKLIFDIGMHDGTDTHFYLAKGFKVIAVEANPYLVAKAEIRFKNEIQNGQLVIINKAIGPDELATVDFYISETKDDWGTIYKDWNSKYEPHYKCLKVDVIKLDTLISEYGTPYYMKIDIEGADVLCLRALLKSSIKPTHLSIELLSKNNFATKNVDCLEIIAYLYAIGYRTFQVADQSKNALLKCPNPALEGEYHDFTFSGTSSGLFGKEMLLPTLSVDEVSSQYLDYFYSKYAFIQRISKQLERLGKKIGIHRDSKSVFHEHGWFDLHAS
jgi:FkbM family methyltransferase